MSVLPTLKISLANICVLAGIFLTFEGGKRLRIHCVSIDKSAFRVNEKRGMKVPTQGKVVLVNLCDYMRVVKAGHFREHCDESPSST